MIDPEWLDMVAAHIAKITGEDVQLSPDNFFLWELYDQDVTPLEAARIYAGNYYMYDTEE